MMRKFLIFIVLLGVMAGGAVTLMPWTQWAEQEIETRLKAQGYPDADISIERVGLGEIVFKDMKVREDIRVEDVAISYSAADFIAGKKWDRTWRAGKIIMKDMPELSAQGKLGMENNVLSVDGVVNDVADGGKAEFILAYPLAAPEKMMLTVVKGDMPWAGGYVRIGKTVVPLDGKTVIRADVQIEQMGIQDLMSLATGQPVSATGTLSGKVPVIIRPDGTFTLDAGRLAANGNGTISLPASLVPGEGEQIDMTRSILENFEYDGLSVDVKPEGKKGGVSLLLALSGKNPKVYDGRAVKLNVRLGGDVLEFLQSNVLLFTKPEQMLRQETK